MTRHHDALLHLALNRIIEGLPVYRMRGQIQRKFTFNWYHTAGDLTMIVGGFLGGYGPESKTKYALSFAIDPEACSKLSLHGYVLGVSDHALAAMAILQHLEDQGEMKYGLVDQCLAHYAQFADEFDALTRAAAIDLRDINTNSFRELN